MCSSLKKENEALKEQIEAVKLAIDIQKRESNLKAEQDCRVKQKIHLNLVILRAVLDARKIVQKTEKPVTSSLEEKAVQR